MVVASALGVVEVDGRGRIQLAFGQRVEVGGVFLVVVRRWRWLPVADVGVFQVSLQVDIAECLVLAGPWQSRWKPRRNRTQAPEGLLVLERQPDEIVAEGVGGGERRGTGGNGVEARAGEGSLIQNIK